MTSNINNILILAGDAAGNLGDQAIFQSTCNELLSLKPELQIYVISKPTNYIAGINNIHPIKPGASGFVQLVKATIIADLTLCGGGGLFQDDDSLIKMPYWALRLLVIRLFCDNIIGYSLGVGPLSAASSRFFARIAFSCMQQVSVRDPIAQDTAQKLTSKHVIIVPDPALLLQSNSDENIGNHPLIKKIKSLQKPLIGVAVRRWFPAKARIIPNIVSAKFRKNTTTSVEQSKHLCKLYAKALDQLVIKHNAHIVFLPSYNVAHESDDKLCQDIINRMSTKTADMLVIESPSLYKTVTSHLDVLICGRMHPSIFAATSGTPVVGLAYNPKFLGLFSMLKLEEYVIDVCDFVHKDLTNHLVDLTSETLANKQNTTDRLEKLQNDIRTYNRTILGLNS